MNNAHISEDDTLLDIITRYPETRELFITHGFPQLRDDRQLENMGGMLTFAAAMKARKKHPATFMQLLVETVEQARMLTDQGSSFSGSDDALQIAGILPCPVKLPLLDALERFAASSVHTIDYELQSASGGLDWLEERYRSAGSADEIPDLALSAGFELFFDTELIGGFRDAGVFADLSSLTEFSSDFDGLGLRDPRGNYSILAGVPAVFLVDTLELRGRKAPETWEELISGQFRNSISLPVEDLDLFNAVCLTLYRRFGAEAVRSLGRNMLRSMHPAQMVKEGSKTSSGAQERPAVTVLPWFFTRMIFAGTSLQIIWPKDGAILSPIFAAAKAEKADRLRDVLAFFESTETGTLMREKGYFPCVNPQVDNDIPAGGRFQWLGWDFIYDHDVGKLIRTCTALFNEAVHAPAGREES